jgi:hypothetical protein
MRKGVSQWPVKVSSSVSAHFLICKCITSRNRVGSLKVRSRSKKHWIRQGCWPLGHRLSAEGTDTLVPQLYICELGQNRSQRICMVTGQNTRKTQNILAGKPPGKIPFARPSPGWENNIKIDLRNTACQSMGWIELAQDRAQWRLWETVMNIRVQ